MRLSDKSKRSCQGVTVEPVSTKPIAHPHFNNKSHQQTGHQERKAHRHGQPGVSSGISLSRAMGETTQDRTNDATIAKGKNTHKGRGLSKP